MHLVKFGDASETSPSLLLISDREPLISTAGIWGESFGEDFLLYVPDAALPAADKVQEFVADVLQAVARVGIKRTTVFGIGAGASIAMALAVQEPRVVRRLVMLDGTSRIEPTVYERIVDKVEEKLPLGLPFRSASKRFDARPVLHLLHCPTLVLTSPGAERFVHEQGELLKNRIPNSWSCQLRSNAFEGTQNEHMPSAELLKRLHEFLQLPVKRPQKNKAKRLQS